MMYNHFVVATINSNGFYYEFWLANDVIKKREDFE